MHVSDFSIRAMLLVVPRMGKPASRKAGDWPASVLTIARMAEPLLDAHALPVYQCRAWACAAALSADYRP